MKTPDNERRVDSRAAGLGLRREERIEVALPVMFEGGGRGVTKNVSASGIYFETDQRVTLGAPVSFSIELEPGPGGPLRVRCDANILRVEELDGRRGIAATLLWTTH